MLDETLFYVVQSKVPVFCDPELEWLYSVISIIS